MSEPGTASYTTAMDPAKAVHQDAGKGPFTAADGPSGDAITFAQLSDPHLSSPAGAGIGELLNKRMLGYLSWRGNRRLEHDQGVLNALVSDMAGQGPDHVVITGDLTHLGLGHECRQALQWLETLGNPYDVTVIPGNHDTYVPASWQETVGLWEPYMVSDRRPSNTDAEDLFPSLRVRGPVALIGLSSARPSAPFLAVGSLGKRQLAMLETLLEQTRQQRLFRVVLVHHVPNPANYKWRKRLIDGNSLCRILERLGVELVLHGHTHRAMEAELSTASGIAPVIGLPSASALGRGHRQAAQYNLYHVRRTEAGWDLSISVRGYARDQGVFAPAGQRLLHLPQR